ncbi:hypothetical protein AB0O68_34690 [Streptomyces sp. NPDC087512]|uniref:hypothetical protein n=1 Tax=Streptomyces sp. NPDC087512 TaxID=3155059 RepID=UPI00343A5994
MTQRKTSWLLVSLLVIGFAVVIGLMSAVSWFQEEQRKPSRPAADDLTLAKAPYMSISGPGVHASISNSSGLACSYVVKVQISGSTVSGTQLSAEGSETVFVAAEDDEQFVVGVVEPLGGEHMENLEKVKLLSIDRSCSD